MLHVVACLKAKSVCACAAYSGPSTDKGISLSFDYFGSSIEQDWESVKQLQYPKRPVLAIREKRRRKGIKLQEA